MTDLGRPKQFNRERVMSIVVQKIQEGKNGREIARELGWSSENAFSKFVKKCGYNFLELKMKASIHGRDFNDVKKEVKRMILEGKDPQEISNELGWTSKRSLYDYFEKNGLRLPDFRKEIMKELKNGK